MCKLKLDLGYSMIRYRVRLSMIVIGSHRFLKQLFKYLYDFLKIVSIDF
jgi:hypothetical protein